RPIGAHRERSRLRRRVLENGGADRGIGRRGKRRRRLVLVGGPGLSSVGDDDVRAEMNRLARLDRDFSIAVDSATLRPEINAVGAGVPQPDARSGDRDDAMAARQLGGVVVEAPIGGRIAADGDLALADDARLDLVERLGGPEQAQRNHARPRSAAGASPCSLAAAGGGAIMVASRLSTGALAAACGRSASISLLKASNRSPNS